MHLLLELTNVNWLIIKEFEQIDLRLVDEFNKKAIFIENKIDTSSHSGQLSRYFKNWKENYKGGAFIYLTINGAVPNDDGFDELIYPKKEIMKEIIIISYKREIFDWLNSSLSQIKSDKVRHTIIQYLNIIITL